MATIHYKFKATLEYKTVMFEEMHVSANDLKKAIFDKEKINPESLDLLLTNAHTKRTYSDDDVLPRDATVIVLRIPRNGAHGFAKLRNLLECNVVSDATRTATISNDTPIINSEGNVMEATIENSELISSQPKVDSSVGSETLVESRLKKSESELISGADNREFPLELGCAVCNQLLRDAVLVTCCGETFCAECVHQLVKSSRIACPNVDCPRTAVFPNDVIPNLKIRQAVKTFKRIGFSALSRSQPI